MLISIMIMIIIDTINLVHTLVDENVHQNDAQIIYYPNQ